MRRLATVLPVVLLLVLPGFAHGQGRVVGGSVAAVGEYPWQVALMVGTSNSLYCGGTLVAPQYVLTASHCAVRATDSVLVGTTKLSIPGERIGVSTVRDHPLAGGTSNLPRYDATMLRLDAPVSTSAAKPLALARPGVDDGLWAAGTLLTVSGWGRTSPGGGVSDSLRYALVPRTTDAYCARADVYGSFFNVADMVCAGFVAGGTDTCQGDSGGPIAAPVGPLADPTDPADWRLVGITSWGDGCALANRPGVYARLGAPVLGDWVATEPPVADADVVGRLDAGQHGDV